MFRVRDCTFKGSDNLVGVGSEELGDNLVGVGSEEFGDNLVGSEELGPNLVGDNLVGVSILNQSDLLLSLGRRVVLLPLI